MNQDEFDKVEAPAIAQLVSLGWEYISGKDLSPSSNPSVNGSPEHIYAGGKGERTYLRDVVLVKRLEAAIKRINPWISDEHILSTGVDPKIPPVDLLAANFKDSIKPTKSDESKASEIESAIKHHITINLDDDPEYYRSLSLRLRDIIEKTHGKWAEQLELLFEFTDDISHAHQQAARDVGLTETEFAFYGILMAEVTQASDGDVIDESIHDAIKTTTQVLVSMLEEATEIIDFFRKDDEVKRMKKEIKRAVLDQPFGDKALVAILQERFMELAKTKFGNKS